MQIKYLSFMSLKPKFLKSDTKKMREKMMMVKMGATKVARPPNKMMEKRRLMGIKEEMKS